MELLLKSIAQIREDINPNLSICGILLTMVDKRTNFTKEVISMIKNAYGEEIRIFNEYIPQSIRAAETSATGKSIFTHDLGRQAEQWRAFCATTRPNGKVASAYDALAKVVLENA